MKGIIRCVLIVYGNSVPGANELSILYVAKAKKNNGRLTITSLDLGSSEGELLSCWIRRSYYVEIIF